ncbi:MAG: hypothetical protein K2N56_13040 [Oscillospiraceae bacterium]|nr:hypothetical protein [Oscillospiraceae bacterium]
MIQRMRDTSEPYSPHNDMGVYKLSAQLSIFGHDDLRAIGEGCLYGARKGRDKKSR